MIIPTPQEHNAPATVAVAAAAADRLPAATPVPGGPCPLCGRHIDSHLGVHDDLVPEAGALAICFYCLGLTVYDAELRARELTDAELEEVTNDAATWELIARLRASVRLTRRELARDRS